MTALTLNNPLAQDYDGEKGDAEAGREYFKKRFASLAEVNSKGRQIHARTSYAFFWWGNVFHLLTTLYGDKCHHCNGCCCV